MSQGYAYDKLIVQVALSQFPNENQVSLPVSINKVKDIPRQASSKAEAEIIDDVGNSIQIASTGVCSISFVLSLIMKISLNSLWSLLNGL